MTNTKGPLLIVGNGGSARVDYTQVRCPILTTNAAWSLRWMPDYHLALDIAQRDAYPAVYGDLHDAGRLYVAGGSWPVGKNIGFNQSGDKWSFNPLRDGVVEGWAGTGSVVYAALQLAIALGYGPLYVIGLDLSGPRFDGSKGANAVTLARQKDLFNYAARVVTVNIYCCNPVSECESFPKIPWDKALVDMNWMYPAQEVKLPEQAAMAEPQ